MFRKYSTTDLTAALLTALAIILSYFPEIPLAFFAPWLKAGLLAFALRLLGFSIGPGMAIIATCGHHAVHILGGTTGGIGDWPTSSSAWPSSCPLLHVPEKPHLARGHRGHADQHRDHGVCRCAGQPLHLLPTYFGSGFEQAMGNMGMSVSGYLWGGILPFNLIKGGINCLLVQALYKRLSGFMKKSVSEVAIPNGKQG